MSLRNKMSINRRVSCAFLVELVPLKRAKAGDKKSQGLNVFKILDVSNRSLNLLHSRNM